MKKRKPNKKLVINRTKLNRESIRHKFRKLFNFALILSSLCQFFDIGSLIQLNSFNNVFLEKYMLESTNCWA